LGTLRAPSPVEEKAQAETKRRSQTPYNLLRICVICEIYGYLLSRFPGLALKLKVNLLGGWPGDNRVALLLASTMLQFAFSPTRS
jgi:hypothetical protein